MKKLITLVLAAMLVLSLAACNTTTPETTPAPETTVDTTPADTTVDTTPADTTGEIVEDTDPVEFAELNSCASVLDLVWAKYGEEERFAVMGGNPEAMYMAGPYNYDLTYAENLTYNLLIPADQVANVAEAGTMIHMMNANTFTGGVVKLTEGTDITAFAKTMRDTITTNQWMCGFPERVYIAVIEEQYLLISFGVNDAMTPFVTHLTEAHTAVQVLHDEPLV